MAFQVDRKIGSRVARIVGVSVPFTRSANQVAAKVRAGWGAHRDTGNFASSVTVSAIPGKEGVVDRWVGSSADGIVSAEFGHLTGRVDGFNRRWVPGLHVFGKVAG